MDELREFDDSYRESSGSVILDRIAKAIRCKEGDIAGILPIENEMGFTFQCNNQKYKYFYKEDCIERIETT